MALIKLSSIGITNLSGKAGGSVYAHNRGGAYMRNFAVPSNPQTQAQMHQRSLFGALSSAWKSLTQEQRDAWIAAAPEFPYINRFGDEKVMSGENLFISLNRNRQIAGFDNAILNPPVPEGVTGLTTMEIVAQLVGGTLTLSLSAVPIDAPLDTTFYAVFASPPVSPGVNYVKNKFRKVAVIEGTTIEDENIITSDYLAVFGDLPVGSKVILRIAPINTDTGERGADFFGSQIVTEETP